MPAWTYCVITDCVWKHLNMSSSVSAVKWLYKYFFKVVTGKYTPTDMADECSVALHVNAFPSPITVNKFYSWPVLILSILITLMIYAVGCSQHISMNFLWNPLKCDRSTEKKNRIVKLKTCPLLQRSEDYYFSRQTYQTGTVCTYC